MPIPVNPDEQLIVARLVEFLTPSTSWNRSLWSPGTILQLKELLEAVDASRQGILRSKPLERLGSSCLRVIGLDCGLTSAEKSILNHAIKGIKPDNLDFHLIAQLVPSLEENYLLKWGEAIGGPSPPQPERTARSLSSHLLDLGYSGDFLRKWWIGKTHGSGPEPTVRELCEAAHGELCGRVLRAFEVAIAFVNSPKSASGFPPGWLPANDLTKWLTENNFHVSEVRISGGFILQVNALDSESATTLAADRIAQLVARSSVATSDTLRPWRQVWIKGETNPHSIARAPRGVRVKALYREDQIFTPSDGIVDAAVDLLAELENSSPTSAVASGWAAIEALLAETDDRATAADRLAAIIACSFPRAELTVLSYAGKRSFSRSLLDELDRCDENRDRAAIIAREVASGSDLHLQRQTDRAALRRIQRILESPNKRLNDIATHVGDALHRLYRQRNLILHGGKTNSVALRAGLRTTAKLVGAGMDRIVHGSYVKNLRPIELAARARIAIDTASESNPVSCADLLGI